jgi:hypothetical protein
MTRAPIDSGADITFTPEHPCAAAHFVDNVLRLRQRGKSMTDATKPTPHFRLRLYDRALDVWTTACLKVIAEGVEFTDQATFFKRHNCDQMQGYLINAPMPAHELGAILAADDVRVVGEA